MECESALEGGKMGDSKKQRKLKWKRFLIYCLIPICLRIGYLVLVQNGLWSEWLDISSNDDGQQAGPGTLDEVQEDEQGEKLGKLEEPLAIEISDLPDYSGKPYEVMNNNVPYFGTGYPAESYEFYGELDEQGRCTVAVACIGVDLMPTAERGSISSVKPSGWRTARYDCVEGKYLYNRCHLIGHQLSGEDANVKNLITGTRYLNIQGMLSFENEVANYVKDTNNHVMYRVTPLFDGDNLVAEGVMMEGWSVEDNGEGVCFCVFAFNVQPGVTINYATGESWEEEED